MRRIAAALDAAEHRASRKGSERLLRMEERDRRSTMSELRMLSLAAASRR
jgi:hypothetical protein